MWRNLKLDEGVHYIVHGHEQCVVCKTNVEPCCQGQVLKGGRDE